MRGDFSRLSFDPSRGFVGVLLQQGRVVADADWNEAEAITSERLERLGSETIGPSGAPKADAGFDITSAGGDLTVGPGRYWVDGILCVNEAAVAYSAQPDLPGVALPPPEGQGLYVAYLDVWRRHLTALDDPAIREPALGGPDTATRLRTVWQARLMRVGDVDPAPTCAAALPPWEAALAAPKGTLTARLGPTTANPDPCELPPTAGFRGLENQLYRVEVHEGAETLAGARFCWSRDNGSVVTLITQFDGSGIVVDDLGPDEVRGFAPGQWAEIADEHSELLGRVGELVELGPIDPSTRRIEIVGAFSTIPLERKPRLRRWDQSLAATSAGVAAAPLPPANTDQGLVLEDGVEVVLAEGAYRQGDYWLVPARTAISDETGALIWPRDAASTPLPATPHGIEHHYAPLAVLNFDGTSFGPAQDCRKLFPALTTIAAADVSYDDAACTMGAATVQDALDTLCGAHLGDDLRLHNKLLHGSGVVCGLKVVCQPLDRSQVVVQEGYALECEGHCVRVEQEMPFDVTGQATIAQLLDASGNGEVLVALGRDPTTGAPVVTVEPYQKQPFWDEVLEGTLLKDYYDKAIKAPLELLKHELFPIATSGVPVPQRNRRFIALLNLLIQKLNPTTGRYVFLSRAEDQLLREIYQVIKQIIASETFCAMFDADDPFPPYPYPEPDGIRTAFGLFRFHHRIKLHPTRRWAYTCGTGNGINVFDLDTGEQIADLTFPGVTTLDVTDVAVSADGKTLHAVAILQGVSPRDSVFAQATIAADGTHTWDSHTTNVCDYEFVSLATSALKPGRLLALARAHGLYDFDPNAIGPVPGLAVPSFNATGILHCSPDGRWAFTAETTAAPVGTFSTTFTRVRRVDLTNPLAAPVFYPLGGGGSAPDTANDVLLEGTTLWVTGAAAPGHVKTLWSFNRDTAAAVHAPVDLHDSAICRLAAVPSEDALLVTNATRHLARRYALSNAAQVAAYRVPLQIMPTDIVTASDGRTVCVANMFSSTVSLVDAATVLAASPLPSYTNEPPLTLLQYRQGILDAFDDLLKHILFYLKDKFCDQFLIKCPTCGPEDRVILGAVEIKSRQVYKICNFTNRHYVKSFNTYGYWLSTLPVLPIAKVLFAKFCCWVF
jgi:hypothetical protein